MLTELDLRSLWKELDAYETELEEESKSLQDIWVRIGNLKKINESDISSVVTTKELSFVDLNTVIYLNIGGQLFESTAEVLTRDPFSILAALCRKECPMPCEEDQRTFFFDRDWWIFRHILSYLRSSVLPTDLDTLKELYTEASYYRIELLQKAIEEIPLDRIRDYNGSVMTYT
mmetsp:Transcript_20840/g.29969  ORF Transcript_20840/g.29969 Transcript_20840/m.29969 type:complete len:174 (-) Transcript_20840:98-619(-)